MIVSTEKKRLISSDAALIQLGLIAKQNFKKGHAPAILWENLNLKTKKKTFGFNFANGSKFPLYKWQNGFGGDVNLNGFKMRIIAIIFF
jgi:hypothetical protein